MVSYDERSAMLWDVVLGDASWSEIVQAISANTAGSAVFFMQGLPGRYFEYWCHNFDDGSRGGTGKPSDLLDPELNSLAIPMNRAPTAFAYDRRDLISDEAYRRDPSMAYLRQRGVFHGMLSKLEGSPSALGGIWIGFSEHRGDDCLAVAEEFKAWLWPLQRALRARSVVRDASECVMCFSDALSNLKVAAVVVDRELQIKKSNSEADRIFSAEDGVICRFGRLVLNSSSRQHELYHRLQCLWLSPGSASSEPVRAARPSGLPDYALDVIPARGGGVFATVIISDPVATHALPDIQRITQRFDLTASEARVARLVPLALSKAQIAQQLGLSENTVKFHLSSVRAKIGAKNMVELALVIQRA